ncbi:substrate-binding periplasmic protein [Leucobacter denitrificans]|uniref:Amino acid ABC transporter substrate-binding protein n=1 Tax=Leucobacter denitrificans TaxID=683042 RepID=A0A7G9S2B4_9MICO|nr:transporter substrate-binding domain-containing protein [Leucobacter denitrificans]QNN61989.1 amino acid ABC transporter substrate-binding protein [Leucobacter denitrificans]
MKKIHKVATSIAVAMLAVTTLASCSSSSDTGDGATTEDCTPRWEFPTISDGMLTVSINELMPYFSENGGAPQGVDADFLKAFAADACLDIDWQVQPASSVIQAVASGRADVAGGGWYATEERGEIVGLSDPIYVELPTIASADGTSDIEDLRGKVVGTISGYTWNEELAEIAGELKEYQSSDATLQDLQAGRIEYALVGGIDAPYIVDQTQALSEIKTELMDPNPVISSSVEPQLPNICHTKGNDELTAALNEKINEMHENGDYAKIVETYGLDPRIVDVDQFA